MSVARRDDRHNEDLAREISDSFNRTVAAKRADTEDTGTEGTAAPPRFVVTGDRRYPKRDR
ncbi:hypothetical protein SAMN05421810_105138 [Amycolatopsis arida]|uniref:Uncharacterized protein n=1 Tax=Amycolatopsis arida TaxID=587909 RepID=A0A1I5WJJ5_9PSEU|nr:hypothetical protein [Amycolatopsis arida]TDX92312.1 hypothetical protein CLV69_105157 [Amycolatopsis arida]SFQ19771.1 hypothetical protein SAMN05421810_105138 [Amycolatopsis arida]